LIFYLRKLPLLLYTIDLLLKMKPRLVEVESPVGRYYKSHSFSYKIINTYYINIKIMFENRNYDAYEMEECRSVKQIVDKTVNCM